MALIETRHLSHHQIKIHQMMKKKLHQSMMILICLMFRKQMALLTKKQSLLLGISPLILQRTIIKEHWKAMLFQMKLSPD